MKTHESVQGDPEYTSLPEKDLCCAILPFRDGPVASPPEIKDTTHCMQKVKRKKRELSCKFYEMSEWQQKDCQADHIDVSGPPEQLPVTVWERPSTPPYVPLCNMSSNRTDT